MSAKYKICLLGAAGVGKTSLVRRYTHQVFYEQYLTTVGVAIETKHVQREDHDVDLVIWDLSGEDEFQHVRPTYVRGASGYLLVVDRTRGSTLQTARALQAKLLEVVGPLPWALVLNKSDLMATWDLDTRELVNLSNGACQTVETSAKTGAGVGEAFEALVDAIEGPWQRVTQTMVTR